MSERYNAKEVAARTMETLKDFQRATVDHVIGLYEKDCNRVLVADEVGLGKTVVARGVIARFAELREREGDDLVKVVYICSNQSIASQNVQKLRVSAQAAPKFDLAEVRLSMQHLRIAEQEYDPESINAYVQIIPLTPETSFRMTGGRGLRPERALMYVILERVIQGTDISALKLRRRLYAGKWGTCKESEDVAWADGLKKFQSRVAECEKRSGGKYPSELIETLKRRGVVSVVRELVEATEADACGRCIRQLRQLFAEESAAMLKPDLVIMDEFQRFRFLIGAESDSETQILVRRFLLLQGEDPLQKVRILLLSATPYKLYSTAAEIAETGQDEEYRDFMELIRFLFDGHHEHASEIWSDYSRVLRERSVGFAAVLSFKRKAEEVLSQAICRTERVAVMDDGDFISDVEAGKTMDITPGDVASYIEFSRMLKVLGLGLHLPVDYVKSCPFLMSYLRGYQLKEKIEGVFHHRGKSLVDSTRGRHLWLKKGTIEEYHELPKSNARLELLKEHAFQGNAALFMWVPPTLPYYPMQGVYAHAGMFSKILVFSSWEMVPRMISTLVSYEAERKVFSCELNRRYSQRHHQRLREQVDKQKTAAYEALVDPDDLAWLVGLWNPIETLNAGMDLPAVERLVREKVRARFGRQDDDMEEVWVNKALGSPVVCIARRIGLSDRGVMAVTLAKLFWERFNNAIGTAIVDRASRRKRSDAFHWQNVLAYCKDGCFQAMFDEYYAVVRDEVSFASGEDQTKEIVKRMSEALTLRSATYDVDTFNAQRDRVCGKGDKQLEIAMRTHFAVGFAKGKNEEKSGIARKDAVRKSFNSPLRPFVLASTSIGQEGLDFHPYCRKIFHWNLPSNPVDLEQREGRINRYKCLAVRENAALKYGDMTYRKDVWAELYAATEAGERREGVPQLVPFWCFGKDQRVKIERIFPAYPCSRDEDAYNRLITILSYYRMSLGQPRQEELIENILRTSTPEEIKNLKNLFINLSPCFRAHPHPAE